MAYQESAHHVVVFGGYAESQGDTWIWGPASPTVPVRVVSRKIHGDAGSFDIDLPLSGTPGLECRSGGNSGDYQVVLTFPALITSIASANASPGPGGSASIANSPAVNANQVTVNLTSVSNAQILMVNLLGVSAGSNTGDVHVPMSVLLGDVNATGRVDAADVSLVRQQTLQAVTSSNFREDVNTSGRIDAADVSIIRQQTLTSLP
jgi:hypothetical protein